MFGHSKGTFLQPYTVIFAGHFYPVEELKFNIDIKHFNPLIVPWGTHNMELT